jgi:hypothetical protein
LEKIIATHILIVAQLRDRKVRMRTIFNKRQTNQILSSRSNNTGLYFF